MIDLRGNHVSMFRQILLIFAFSLIALSCFSSDDEPGSDQLPSCGADVSSTHFFDNYGVMGNSGSNFSIRAPAVVVISNSTCSGLPNGTPNSQRHLVTRIGNKLTNSPPENGNIVPFAVNLNGNSVAAQQHRSEDVSCIYVADIASGTLNYTAETLVWSGRLTIKSKDSCPLL